MKTEKLKFGIPDIELRCAEGATINPGSFAGHELIALFCPIDSDAAEQEIAAYRSHCAEFVNRDAWLLVFADTCPVGTGRALTIPDRDRCAWVAFRDLAAQPEELDRRSGAVFFFTRGGALHRYWRGPGHLPEVIEQLQTAVPAT